MRRYSILGVPIADQSMDAAVADVLALAAATGPRSLFFVNAHTLNNAAEDAVYRDVLRRATRIFGDGTGVRWAARARGLRLAANLNGTDLVPAVLDRADGLRCFLVGSAPERIDIIASRMAERFPRVKFVGCHHGYLDGETSLAVLDKIEASRADIVLVGMGNPIQERWIDRFGDKVPGALMIAVGGFLEYWSGGLDRAPIWMRRAGVEWVHLLVKQPRKARRYLIGNPLYVARMLRHLPADLRAMKEFEEARFG